MKIGDMVAVKGSHGRWEHLGHAVFAFKPDGRVVMACTVHGPALGNAGRRPEDVRLAPLAQPCSECAAALVARYDNQQ